MKKLIFATLILALGCSDSSDSGNGDGANNANQGRDPDTTECFSNLTGLNKRDPGQNQVVFFNTTDTFLKLTVGTNEYRLDPMVPSEQIFPNGLHLADVESGELKGAIDFDVNQEFGQTIWLTMGEGNCIEAGRAVKRFDTNAISVANLAYPNIEVSDSDEWQLVAQDDAGEPFSADSTEFFMRLPNGESALRFEQSVMKPTVAYALFGESVGYYLITEDGEILRTNRTFRLRSFVEGATADFEVCSDECTTVASGWGAVTEFELQLAPILEVGLGEATAQGIDEHLAHTTNHFETELDIYVFPTNDGPRYVTMLPVEPTTDEIDIINLTENAVTVERFIGDQPEVVDIAPGQRIVVDPAEYFVIGESRFDTPLDVPHSLAVFTTPINGDTVIGHLETDHMVWNGDRAVGETCTMMDPCNAEGQCLMGTCRPLE